MSYPITKTLPLEIVYAYAMIQRYNSINKKNKNQLYSDQLRVALRQEDLDNYVNTFTTFYQAKYHEALYVFKIDPTLNFGAYNYVSQNKKRLYISTTWTNV